jgi:hypothetical protein
VIDFRLYKFRIAGNLSLKGRLAGLTCLIWRSGRRFRDGLSFCWRRWPQRSLIAGSGEVEVVRGIQNYSYACWRGRILKTGYWVGQGSASWRSFHALRDGTTPPVGRSDP